MKSIILRRGGILFSLGNAHFSRLLHAYREGDGQNASSPMHSHLLEASVLYAAWLRRYKANLAIPGRNPLKNYTDLSSDQLFGTERTRRGLRLVMCDNRFMDC
jgi:hypothetical protein